MERIDSQGKTFVYDGHNRRVRHTNASNKTEYSLYSLDGTLLYRETDDGPINYIYLGNRLIAKDGFIPEKSLHQQEKGKQHYRPFGESIEGEIDDVGYIGHKFDKDSGLSYMQARYYDPVIGRFYSNDPVGSVEHLSTQNGVHGFNRFTYANNNPYTYTDPSGLASIKIHFKDQQISSAGFSIPQSISNGHSAIVIINDLTGATFYNEFGRYNGTAGMTRSFATSDLNIGPNGVPTAESLNNLLKDISTIGSASASSDIGVEYRTGGSFEAMQREVDKWVNRTWYPIGANCHDFCSSVVNAGESSGTPVGGTLGPDNSSLIDDIRASYNNDSQAWDQDRLRNGVHTP